MELSFFSADNKVEETEFEEEIRINLTVDEVKTQNVKTEWQSWEEKNQRTYNQIESDYKSKVQEYGDEFFKLIKKNYSSTNSEKTDIIK